MKEMCGVAGVMTTALPRAVRSHSAPRCDGNRTGDGRPEESMARMPALNAGDGSSG